MDGHDSALARFRAMTPLKLTDDELTQINGNREQLEGKLQSKYGYAKDKAKQEIDDWCNRMK